MNLAEIESEVFALSFQDRAALTKRLLLSLEEVSDAEFETLWGEESARRAAEFDLGIDQAIPGLEVAKKARALLR
jgi:hypothetical protein